jgi:hypothetical protein
MFADDLPFDILGDEEDGVQFFADSGIGAREEFLAKRYKFVVGEANPSSTVCLIFPLFSGV